jgi:hypothetical protein
MGLGHITNTVLDVLSEHFDDKVLSNRFLERDLGHHIIQNLTHVTTPYGDPERYGLQKQYTQNLGAETRSFGSSHQRQ